MRRLLIVALYMVGSFSPLSYSKLSGVLTNRSLFILDFTINAYILNEGTSSKSKRILSHTLKALAKYCYRQVDTVSII